MRGRKNVLNEREMVIQAVLHTADKLNTLSGSAENVVLQCYVYNRTIRERTENLPLALDFNLTCHQHQRPLPSTSQPI